MSKCNEKNIVIIGGGGREHAIACCLNKRKGVRLFAIPGNAGISQIAECISHIKATDIDKIVEWVDKRGDIYLTVVAPDDPLAMGLVDKLQAKGHRAFGPSAAAAHLEASKAYAKDLMRKYNIPSAGYEVFEDRDKVLTYLKKADYPTVIKADGLALGKGVVIAGNYQEAEKAVNEMLVDKKFGNAGSKVVVEEFLKGFEVSMLAFTDGNTVITMASSQDHKRAYDNDEGPNTGGMGAFCPSEKYTDELHKLCMEAIYKPTIKAMKAEGREFRGVIYFGLMIDNGIPKVLEYNARFGDPETQVVLLRLKSDLLEIMEACIDGQLDKVKVEWDDNCTICVVAASGGYPEDYKKGIPISIGKIPNGAEVYHAGTAWSDKELVTNGGRVLCVTGKAKDMKTAKKLAYDGIKQVKFGGMFYRNDIGGKQ
ncbi:MAG: phosphoribosylamine--glycine ligase [Firmicutes bacterium]|nr:phosphoribosylamine--glycine ligase [Bacillota bacterium]